MKHLKLAVALALSLFVASAMAEIVKVPTKRPAITVDIPKSWEPEETKRGVSCESPDQVATLFFEIAASEKSVNALIDENIEWLTQEQDVKIDGATKEEKELLVGGIQSSQMSYDAHSKEFGRAKVGFIFTTIGKKLLVTTYWFSVKGYDKHAATVTRILDSVKPIQ